MYDKLKGVEERFMELETLLSDPEIIKNRDTFQKYVREHAGLAKIISVFRTYKQKVEELEESMGLLRDGDSEIKQLARDEIESLSLKKESLENELKKLLVPKDANDEKNVILEIRAGTGGEEIEFLKYELEREEKKRLFLQMIFSGCTAGMLKIKTGKLK